MNFIVNRSKVKHNGTPLHKTKHQYFVKHLHHALTTTVKLDDLIDWQRHIKDGAYLCFAHVLIVWR